MNILKYLAGLLLAVTLSQASAAASGVEQLNRFLADLKSLQANFEQSVLDPDHREAVRSQGVFYLQRPGRFRWDYSEPERQQIIADGSDIWMYEPELEQVSVKDQKDALRGTPAMLLISGDPVEKHFEVIDIGESQGLAWVELIPRDKESQFTRILLAFLDNELQRMEMDDKFGQVSRFQFFDIQHNPVFADGFFVFEQPLMIDRFQN